MKTLLQTVVLTTLLATAGVATAQTTVKPAPAAAPTNTPAPVAKPAEDPNAIRVLLAPALETTLVSQIVGRVAAVNVHLGQSFSKGKTLVQFDCSEQSARVEMAQAELASARENHEAKVRLQGLQQAGEVEVSMAASNAAKARAQVNLYRAQLGQCSIQAPFAGQVVKIAVKPHQGVNQGQPLLEIVSDGPLKLRLNAPAKWVGWLKIGTPFEVAIEETGKRYQAKVSALNARIDAVSQTIELEATMVTKAPDLLPGMSGTARFTPPT
jgi:membrane fusion protein, multidrug efflux system